MGKELLQAAADHFGNNDLDVIFGVKDKHDEAECLGIDYDTYRKRLQRKLAKFKFILKDNGYKIH
jgi:hypothetical protein